MAMCIRNWQIFCLVLVLSIKNADFFVDDELCQLYDSDRFPPKNAKVFLINPNKGYINPTMNFVDLWTSECRELGSAQSTDNPLRKYVSKITEVTMEHNNIVGLKPNIFCNLINLRYLDLKSNHLQNASAIGFAQENCLDDYCGKELMILYLDNNPLGIIRKGSFCHLRNLFELHLDDCKLRAIEDGSFENLSKLTTLNLKWNKLTTFPDIKNMPSLIELFLDNNHLTSLKRSDFHNCPVLSRIHLLTNEISSIEDGAFDDFEFVGSLNLRNNRLVDITGLFKIANISTLKLNDNCIEEFSASDFSSTIITLDITNNVIQKTDFEGYKSCYDDGSNCKLNEIHLSFNVITELDELILPPSARFVDFSHNLIEHLALHPVYESSLSNHATHLQVLKLNNNRLTVLPMLPQLEHCQYNFYYNPLQCSDENFSRLQNYSLPTEILQQPCNLTEVDADWVDIESFKVNIVEHTYNRRCKSSSAQEIKSHRGANSASGSYCSPHFLLIFIFSFKYIM